MGLTHTAYWGSWLIYNYTIILFITLFIIFKKFNILVDDTNYSDHKKIGKHMTKMF